MIFFKNIILFLILFFLSFQNVFADNHDANKKVLEEAKKINEEINSLEEDVPLNDPFAGNEGSNSASKANLSEEEQQDEFSLYNYKLSGLISGINHSYITLTDGSGDVITLTLGQNLGNNKLIDLRLTEAIFIKEDKSYLIIDFNNIVREASEY